METELEEGELQEQWNVTDNVSVQHVVPNVDQVATAKPKEKTRRGPVSSSRTNGPPLPGNYNQPALYNNGPLTTTNWNFLPPFFNGEPSNTVTNQSLPVPLLPPGMDTNQALQLVSILYAKGLPLSQDWSQNLATYQLLVDSAQRSLYTSNNNNMMEQIPTGWTKGGLSFPILENQTVAEALHSDLPLQSAFSITGQQPSKGSFLGDATNEQSMGKRDCSKSFANRRKVEKSGHTRGKRNSRRNQWKTIRNLTYVRENASVDDAPKIDASKKSGSFIYNNMLSEESSSKQVGEQKHWQQEEPPHNEETLEFLRSQAKKALMRGDTATNEPHHTETDVRVDANEEKAAPTSSLIITMDSESDSSEESKPMGNTYSANLVSEQNSHDLQSTIHNTHSRLSTLEDLRKRVEELEERKRLLEKRGKLVSETTKPNNTNNRNQNHSHFASKNLPKEEPRNRYTSNILPSNLSSNQQPFLKTVSKEPEDTPEKVSNKTMTVGEIGSTIARDLSSRDRSLGSMDKQGTTEESLVALEQETAKAWEEHNKNITEEIEARNKLIRICTSQQVARDSANLLKELLENTQSEITEYEYQTRCLENEIKEIESRRQEAFLLAEKRQRQLDRLRRWLAMEALSHEKEQEDSKMIISNQWSSTFENISPMIKQERKKTKSELPFVSIQAPSPFTSQSLRPIMSVFRCFPLLQSIQSASDLLTWQNQINPHSELCRYDLHGSCTDTECAFQHAKDYSYSSSALVQSLCKSFETLFWIRYGDVPEEKLVSRVQSEFSSAIVDNVTRTDWWKHWIQERTSAMLMESHPSSSPSFIPLNIIETPISTSCEPLGLNKKRIKSSSSLFTNFEEYKAIALGLENDPCNEYLIITKAKLLYEKGQWKRAIETLARGLERISHSSMLWKLYLSLFVPRCSASYRETLIKEASLHCPGYSWEAFVKQLESHVADDEEIRRTSRYYVDKDEL